MDIKEVKDLIQDVLRSDIREFELEHTGTRIKIRRAFGRNGSTPDSSSASSFAVSSSFPGPAREEVAPKPAEESAAPSEDKTLHIITSPIVGTFYRAPAPEADPYVKAGDSIEEGSILCLVEAMKLMNEIPSDIAGEIVRIYVENGRPVEFGQKLFGIRPHSQG